MKNKYLKRLFGIIFAMVMIALQMLPVLPMASVKAMDTNQSKVVRVACGMNDALYLDENGDPQGACLFYIRQLAWNNGWTIEYVNGSYSEGIQNLYDGKVDLMFPVGKDDDFEGKLAYADFIGGYQQIGLFAKEDADVFYDDYEGYDGKKVGLSMGANSNILNEVAQEHGFTYTPVALNSIQDKIDALMNGDVDMIAFSTLNTVPGGKLVSVLDQVPFYFCTRADDTQLMAEVNAGMSMAMINTPDVVTEMYQNVLKGSNKISFTREENNKIKSTSTITFGVYGDRLPLAGLNSDGECVGIYVDILKAISEESGLKIEVKPIEDSNKLYSYLDDGTVDFVIGAMDLRFSSDNADNHLSSNGISDLTNVAVTLPSYQFESDDMPVFALTKDRNYLESYIFENFPEAKIDYYDNRKQCLNAVRDGNADATFLNTWEYNYESKNPRFQNMMEWESIRINSQFSLGATRQSDLEVLTILEKTVSQLSKEQVAEIITTNINMTYDTYDLQDRLYTIKDEFNVVIAIALVLLICFVIYMNVKRRYIKELVVANKTKDDFLSRMSHELRTPLNAIQGYATLTEHDASSGSITSENVVQNMESIEKASEYLLGIIRDILDVQRMETGKLVLEKSEINPKEYMGTVVKMIQPMADEKRIDFTYTMINGGDDNYYMDGLRVQQILFNILYNAVKFTPGGGTVTMTSDVMKKNDKDVTIRFIVADTGIGMSKEFLEQKLFQKFAQENPDITSPYAGCGNSLAICKELVQLMDGEISCESEQGKGTIFTILIKTEARKQTRKRRDRKEMENFDLSGIHVLMCEDNPMNQDMEKRLLERMNCQVDIADDGQIGVDKFKASKEREYDVILMDIRMPNMDGLEATRNIRALDREDAKYVPILAVSANAFEKDKESSLEAGMNEHLAKPVDARILYEKITQYCK